MAQKLGNLCHHSRIGIFTGQGYKPVNDVSRANRHSADLQYCTVIPDNVRALIPRNVFHHAIHHVEDNS